MNRGQSGPCNRLRPGKRNWPLGSFQFSRHVLPDLCPNHSSWCLFLPNFLPPRLLNRISNLLFCHLTLITSSFPSPSALPELDQPTTLGSMAAPDHNTAHHPREVLQEKPGALGSNLSSNSCCQPDPFPLLGQLILVPPPGIPSPEPGTSRGSDRVNT